MPYYFHVQKNSIIPVWLKSSAKWWSEGKISDSEFLSGIQYLIDKKILALEVVNSSQVDPGLDVTVSGQKAVRRGTTQDLQIHVENFEGNVQGATVFVRVEDYGENILKEFKGETDSDGNYFVSYEISTEYTDIETFLVYVDVTDGVSSKTKVFTFQVYCLCGEPSCKCRN
jgi:methionine synthase II (cobalamin-independent)